MSKKVFALIMVTFSILSLVFVASAQEPEKITVWTDRSEYVPGETGTLYIVFYNSEDSEVTIEKIIIVFDNWRAYKNNEWEGNQTLEVVEAILIGGTYVTEITFVVPTDGRAVSTDVSVIVQTRQGDISIPPLQKPSITVAQTPRHMEQIVTLFTVQVVLIIVCTIIIAATIFLSSRKPQIIWQKEEREEENTE